MMNKSINSHLKSITHKTLDESIIGRYFFLKPNFDDVDEIIRKYINIYNKNLNYRGFFVC